MYKDVSIQNLDVSVSDNSGTSLAIVDASRASRIGFSLKYTSSPVSSALTVWALDDEGNRVCPCALSSGAASTSAITWNSAAGSVGASFDASGFEAFELVATVGSSGSLATHFSRLYTVASF